MRRGPRFWRESVRGSAAAFSVVACLLVPVGSVPAQQPDFKQSETWFEQIEPGGTVRVRNSFGNIHARFGGYENRVEVQATTQRLEAGLPPLIVRREVTDSGMDVIVDFSTTAATTRPPDDATSDHVDLVVFVPQGVSLDAQTRDGLIDAKKIVGNVTASSIGGSVRLGPIEGTVRAKTSRGSIAATLQTPAAGDAQSFTTETGDIEVYVWEDADLSVRMATSGEISTDFSLAIEHRRFEQPSKIASAEVGAGGPQLNLTSKQGRVRLFRLQRDFKPDRQTLQGNESP